MGSLKLGSVFGIDLKVHATFLLALGLGAWQWSRFGAEGAAFGVLLVALLFACVVLHELGHSLVAKGFGIPVREIVLLPIGGIARMTKAPKTPGQEFLIAIAGPLVNVAIAGLLLLFGAVWLGSDGLSAVFETMGDPPPSLETLWLMLTMSNGVLALFNMVPALPMDGGRVLRAVLAMGMGQSKATRIAAWVARVLAVGMFGYAVFRGQPMLGLIAMFVFFGAGAELAEDELSGALAGVTVREALNPHPVTLQPGTSLADAIQWLVRNPQPAFAVVLGERLMGVVTRRGLVRAAQEHGPFAYVASVMDRTAPTVPPEATLTEAKAQMNAHASPYVAVVDDGGAFLGLITEVELAQQAALANVFRKFGRAAPTDPRLNQR